MVENVKEGHEKMGKESEDKAERILSIYTRLKQGKVIDKEKESTEYHVSARTIQRDISDIQSFLKNQNAESGEVQEVVYDKMDGGYVLQTKSMHQLESREILAVAKVLLESRALMKSELFPIIHKLTKMCSDEAEVNILEDLLRNEMYHYVELHHGKQLLEHLWKLEQAVKSQKYIEIKYRKLKNQELVTRKVKPVGIMFSNFYFYLTAYIDKINKEEKFQNPDDIFPTIYRVDRLQEFRVLEEHFAVPYTERFEEGEFRKRVQFMYGGRLRKVRLKCKENVVEAILDRLPTAEILRKDGEMYVIQAEVFGDGIDMWIRGQGSNIELC